MLGIPRPRPAQLQQPAQQEVMQWPSASPVETKGSGDTKFSRDQDDFYTSPSMRSAYSVASEFLEDRADTLTLGHRRTSTSGIWPADWDSVDGRRRECEEKVKTCWGLCLRPPATLVALALPVMVILQMIMLDKALLELEGPIVLRWLWAFIVCQAALVIHMSYHFREASILAWSLQWIVYSWLTAVKFCIIIFVYVPQLKYDAANNLLEQIVYFPVIYCILCGKALQHVRSEGAQKTRGKVSQAELDRREKGILDTMLFQDMIWHVVIDMIDIQKVMELASPAHVEASATNTDQNSVLSELAIIGAKNPEQVVAIQTVAGVFVFLGLFFHQQSFPSVAFVASVATGVRGQAAAAKAAPEPPSAPSPKSRAAGEAPVLWSNVHSARSVASGISRRALSPALPEPTRQEPKAMKQSEAQPKQQRHYQRYQVDVVKARKRSAIVSILLIDFPFFVMRTYVYALVLSFPNEEVSASTTLVPPLNNTSAVEAVGDSSTVALFRRMQHLPSPDIWWIKNLVFMILQAMQLRFVQQADLERSQSLLVLMGGNAGRGHRIRKGLEHQDTELREVWKDMDQENEEIVEVEVPTRHFPDRLDTIESSQSMSESPPSIHLQHLQRESTQESFVDSDVEDGEASTPSMKSSFRERLLNYCGLCCCRCCSRRQRDGPMRCLCFTCDCSFGVFLHCVMGLALGWLVAKVDFHQAYAELLVLTGHAVPMVAIAVSPQADNGAAGL